MSCEQNRDSSPCVKSFQDSWRWRSWMLAALYPQQRLHSASSNCHCFLQRFLSSVSYLCLRIFLYFKDNICFWKPLFFILFCFDVQLHVSAVSNLTSLWFIALIYDLSTYLICALHPQISCHVPWHTQREKVFLLQRNLPFFESPNVPPHASVTFFFVMSKEFFTFKLSIK